MERVIRLGGPYDIKKGNKKGISDFLVIGYPYSENTCNFIYVTSFTLLADCYSDLWYKLFSRLSNCFSFDDFIIAKI